MKRIASAVAALLLTLACVACDGPAPSEPEPQPAPQPSPPPSLPGAWHATHVRGRALPDVMYLFDPTTLNGQDVSAHFVVDSAKLTLDSIGGYQHRLWVTQWLGEPGGPPLYPTLRFFHGDFGEWSRAGTELSFESHWLQHHTMTGTFGTDGVLRMRHGFSHGDPRVEFVYGL